MVIGVGLMALLQGLIAEMSRMPTHEDVVVVGPGPRPEMPVETDQIYTKVFDPPPRRPPPEHPFALPRDLPPGECRYRPTGNKRSRRRRKG